MEEQLNNCYENMNEIGQSTLVSVAQSLEKDTPTASSTKGNLLRIMRALGR